MALNLRATSALHQPCTFVALGCLFIFCEPAMAVALTCAEDKVTNGLFCFAESELRETDGIRSSPLYMGGPKEVTRTNYTVAANCATGVLHLKDRRGVSFGGAGPGEGTAQSRELRRYVCAAAVPAPSTKARR